MSSRKNWSDDFHSMLKDTERNISSIKNRLEDKSRTHQLTFASPKGSSMQSSLPLSTPSDRLHKHSSIKQQTPYSLQMTSSQTDLLTSLFKRLEEQSKTISYLSDTVQVQSDEIQRLKDQQNDLENRLRGSSSYNFDRKIEAVHRELRGEVESIHTMLRSHNHMTSGYSQDSSTDYNMSRDIKLQRRMIEDETDSLRREVDSLKNRIMKVESDLNLSLKDTQDVNRRFQGVERDVSNMTDKQRHLQRLTERRENELHYLKNELQEISDVITDLHHERSVSRNVKKTSDRSLKQIKKNSWLDDDEEFTVTRKLSLEYLDDDDSLLTTFLSHSSDINLSLETLNLGDGKENKEDLFTLDVSKVDSNGFLENDILKTETVNTSPTGKTNDLLYGKIVIDDLSFDDSDNDPILHDDLL